MIRWFILASSAMAGLCVADTPGGVRATRTPPVEEAAPLLSESRELMSTRAVVTLAGVDAGTARALFDAAFAELRSVEGEMNEWRPDSPVAALNREAGTGKWTALSPSLCEVLRRSKAAHAATNGAFDPTWASLRPVWRFGTDARARVPETSELAKLCPLVDATKLSLRERGGGGCDARLERKGMQLGLGGVAKGHAVDRAVEALRRLGATSFLVQAGGDLFAAGEREPGRAWRVGVRDPRGGPDDHFAVLEVKDRAFSTSGDYERFFVVDGVRYHHLIDPKTCQPGRASRQASVLANTALEAEFLTKAAFLTGGDAGLAQVERAGAEVVLVTAENEVLLSAGMKERLELRRAPAKD